MKSALELAMEKAKEMSGEEGNQKLTEEQKKQIADIRNEYRGKIAEREVMFQSDLKKLQMVPSEETRQVVDLRKEEFVKERQNLMDEMERKVQKVKEGRGENP